MADVSYCDNLVPLSISLVEYQKDDMFGKMLAYFSLSPYFTICGILTLILFRRDLHTIVLFIGLVLNEALNHKLKKAIAEPRPHCHLNHKVHNKFGMPSSHSQFAWLLSVYVLCYLFINLNAYNATLNVVEKYLYSIGSLSWALIVSYSRIYLRYHTVRQVLFGGLTGAVVGLFWFAFVKYALTPLFPMIISWRVSKLLLIRDSTLIPNALYFEYMCAENEVQRMKRQKITKKMK